MKSIPIQFCLYFLLLISLSCLAQDSLFKSKARQDAQTLSMSLYQNTTQNSKDTTYTIFKNSTINIGNSASIIEGKSNVFKYYHQSPNFQQTMQIDGGSAMTFLFEIAVLRDSFVIKDSDLIKANTVYSLHCRCPPNVHEISKGTITGNKLSNGDWNVEINVVSVSKQQEYPVHVVGIFKYNRQ